MTLKELSLSQFMIGEQSTGARPFQLKRLGIMMRPEPDNPYEVGGVLNPGGVRAPNGDYLLFPRLVALGNYSRIGVARVLFDGDKTPTGVERLGMALEPRELYELNEWTGGGCEDARVSYVEPLGVYVMTYVALGPLGPRAAMAVSNDLVAWTRLGLIDFTPSGGVDMNEYCNKDHMLLPEPVLDPEGRPSIGLIHRPSYEFWKGEYLRHRQPLPAPPNIRDQRWSIWISYCPLENADWANPQAGGTLRAPTFGGHHLLAAPVEQWERERIGAGTPPIRLADHWFMIYHGVEATPVPGGLYSNRYTAAALLLDRHDPRRIVYRSPRPILEPELHEERYGVVDNVVFPTALDQHESYLDVYYGMADGCIGAARMAVPAS